jgi:multidrug efflux pump subunit AcrB
MKREVTITANIAGEDLAAVSSDLSRAITRAGEPPRGATLAVRGQIPPFQDLIRGLATGLALAVVAIFLLLAAYFQSLRMPLVALSTAPAVLAGATLMLWGTGTTLNIQSFIGAIMSLGVAMANAILLLTFAEHRRVKHSAGESAAYAGARRLRPILMTTLAMTAGMAPMALGLGEGGDQAAPLGRAVVGGLLAATAATLFVLPAVFAVVMGRATPASASLDPTDPVSLHFTGDTSLAIDDEEE